MKITKLGHCCILIEHDGARLLTDPGNFTTAQDEITGIDAVLITHEHQDHLHMDSLKKVLKNNPGAAVITNGSVGKLLEAEGIAYTRVGDGEKSEVKGTLIEGHGTKHAQIYADFGAVENTGYFVADRFYFPGDNFYAPKGRAVELLALPVAGPWMKISMAIDFAKEVRAKKAFGVHDGMLMPSFRGLAHRLLKMFASETEFIDVPDGGTIQI